jgi:hypothetical protein
MQAENRKCQNCKLEFTITPEDFGFYEKVSVPAPTFCPQCRLIRRSIWRNEHFLHKKRDALTGEPVFSAYPAESSIKIYDHDYWWSDAWDPKAFAVDYDPARPFFEQIYALSQEVPWCARSVIGSVRSDYCNNAGNLKDAYLCFNGKNSENVVHGVSFSGVNDSCNFYKTKDSRLCHETFSVVDSERMFWCADCAECQNVWFSKDCRNCSNCFGCVNLRNKSYCIFNEQYTKDEYLKKVTELYDGLYSQLQKVLTQVSDFQKKFPVKYMHGKRNQNVRGDYIFASNNTLDSFEVHNVDDIKYSQFIRWAKDSYDYTSWGIGSELIYESVNSGENSQRLKFCFECWPGSFDLEYCIDCHSSSNCFGCVGLRKAEYCILNKQYSKEEYFTLRKEIIEQMNTRPFVSKNDTIYKYGEFFPPEFSPFTYEQSSASDYFPIEENNFFSFVSQPESPLALKYSIEVDSEDLPDAVANWPESSAEKVIGCHDKQKCSHHCVGAFKITKSELEFYRRFAIPLPRTCPNCRYYARMEQMNPMKTWKRQCLCKKTAHDHAGRCENIFDTAYNPEKQDLVYCERCYNLEVM